MSVRNRRILGLLLIAYAIYMLIDVARAADTPVRNASSQFTKADIERGRYFVIAGVCNDCHAMGFAESEGKLPESEWLTGSSIGFKGPWGITYPPNLRLSVQSMNEDQWVARARSPMRPLMPWYALRDMKEQDVRAMYRYIRSLGPKGSPAPAYVPPGKPASAPYFDLEPQNLPKAK